MANKIKLPQRIRKAPVNSQWFINVAKSMGFASMDMIQELMPNTYDMVENNTETAMELIQDMRRNISPRNMTSKQMGQIPHIALGKTALNNALQDIKSGKIYNKNRAFSENEFDKMGGSDDDDFDMGFEVIDGDDDDDMGFSLDDGDDDFSYDDDDEDTSTTINKNITVNKNKTIHNVIDMMPLANVMAGSAEATVQAISAVNEQNMAVETEKIMFNHRVMQNITGVLGAINDNTSELVKFHGDSTSKYYASAISYFEETTKFFKENLVRKGDPAEKEDFEKDSVLFGSIYNAKGNVDLEKFVNRVKENIADMNDGNSVANMSKMILKSVSSFNDIAKNPLGTLMQFGLKNIFAPMTKSFIKSLDESVSTIMPAITAKINQFEDSDNRLFELLYNVFGTKKKIDNYVDLGKYYKGDMSWNGVANKTLVEIIPAHLRRIEAAITGQSERIFDHNKGVFTTAEEVKKSFNDEMKSAKTRGYADAKHKLKDNAIKAGIRGKDLDQFEKDLDEYFVAMTEKGSLINPFLYKDEFGYDVDDLDMMFDGDNTRKKVIREAFKTLSTKDLTKMVTSGIHDSRTEENAMWQEIKHNPNYKGYSLLHNNGLFDKKGELIYDPTKGGLGSKTDKFGLSNLDYLRDIKMMLAKGVRVFSHNNPHSDLYESMKNESNINDSRRTVINQPTSNQEPSIYDTFDTMSNEDIAKLFQNNVNQENNDGSDGGIINKIKRTVNKQKVKKEAEKRGYKNMPEFMKRMTPEQLQRYQSLRNMYESDDKERTGVNVEPNRKKTLDDRLKNLTGKVDETIYRLLFEVNPDMTEQELFDAAINKAREKGGQIKNSPLGSLFGSIQDTFKGVVSYFTGNDYVDHTGKVVKGEKGALFLRIRGILTGGIEKLTDLKGDDDQSLVSKLTTNFMDGFKQFKISLFGEKGLTENDTKETISTLTQKVKGRLPKAIGKGIASTAIKGAIASNIGLLGGLVMPGGPIAAMMMGTTFGFLKQSETFNKWVFGEKDEQGNRMGGFIPKSIIQMIEKNGKGIKIGGAIGAGVGLLPAFLLPGGPVTGALLGMSAGLLSKSDEFQQFLYGDDFANKDSRSIKNGKIGKFISSKMSSEGKKVNPKLATFLGGAGMLAGIGQGIGLLPSFLLPGGPIMGSMLGLAGGILASSDKFQNFLFGDEGEDGKRYGGLLTKFTNWFQGTVMEPFKIKATAIRNSMLDFVEDKVLDPITNMFEPLTQAFRFVVDDTKEKMNKMWHSITDGVVGAFNDNVIKPFGESLEKYVVDPLKRMFNFALKSIGKVLGLMVTAPIRAVTGIVGGLANSYNKRHVLKKDYEERRKTKGVIGSVLGTLWNKDELYKENLQYMNDDYKQKQEDKKKERQAKRDKRNEQLAEMEKQYQEDREFGKKNDWKFRSKKQKEAHEQEVKERAEWMQQRQTVKAEEIAQSGNETVEKLGTIEKLMNQLPTFDDDRKKLLNDMKDTLVGKLDELIKLGFNGTEENQDILDRYKLKLRDRSYVKPEKKDDENKPKPIEGSHAEGLDNVPKDGYVAELHKGEMVVPKEGADDLRDAGEEGTKKNSIISKLFGNKDDKNDKGLFGRIFEKFNDEEKKDRQDNRHGLTQLEQQQAQELLDDQRYAYASRKSVDFLQDKWKEEDKEKEEKKWRAAMLAALEKQTKTTEKGQGFWSKLFGNNGLLGTFFSMGTKLLPLLIGLLAGGSLLNLLTGGDNSVISDAVQQVTDKLNGEDEEHENKDGEYVNNGVEASAKKFMATTGVPYLAKKSAPMLNAAGKTASVAAKGAKKAGSLAKTAGKKLYQYANPTQTVKGVFGTHEFKLPRKGLQKPLGAVTDAASAGKQLIEKFIAGCSQTLSKIMSFASKKIPGLTKVADVGAKIWKFLRNNVDTVVQKFGLKIGSELGENVAKSIPYAGWVLQAGFTTYDLITGGTEGNAANLFQVSEEDVDGNMKSISRIIQTITNFSWASLIWLANDITKTLMDHSFLRDIAVAMYNAKSDSDKNKFNIRDTISDEEIKNVVDLKTMSEKLGVDYNNLKGKDPKDIDWSKYTGLSASEKQLLKKTMYNEKHKTKLSNSAYADESSPLAGQRLVKGVNNWYKNAKSFYSEKDAKNAYGLNKDADMSLIEKGSYFLSKGALNINNFAAKHLGLGTEYSNSEWFRAKNYDKNGNYVGANVGELSYAEARNMKDQKKVDEANEAINKLMTNGINEDGDKFSKWVNNMKIGWYKGKRERARKHMGDKDTKEETRDDNFIEKIGGWFGLGNRRKKDKTKKEDAKQKSSTKKTTPLGEDPTAYDKKQETKTGGKSLVDQLKDFITPKDSKKKSVGTLAYDKKQETKKTDKSLGDEIRDLLKPNGANTKKSVGTLAYDKKQETKKTDKSLVDQLKDFITPKDSKKKSVGTLAYDKKQETKKTDQNIMDELRKALAPSKKKSSTKTNAYDKKQETKTGGKSLTEEIKDFLKPKENNSKIKNPKITGKPTESKELKKQKEKDSKFNFMRSVNKLFNMKEFNTNKGDKLSVPAEMKKDEKNAKQQIEKNRKNVSATLKKMFSLNDDSTKDMTENMKKSQILMTKAYNKQQKSLTDTSKETSKTLDKNTADLKKNLDKSGKSLTDSAKGLFNVASEKVKSMLSSLSNIQVSSIVPTINIGNPVDFVANLLKKVFIQDDSSSTDDSNNSNNSNNNSSNNKSNGSLIETAKDWGGKAWDFATGFFKSGLTRKEKQEIESLNVKKQTATANDFISPSNTTNSTTNNSTNNVNKSVNRFVFYNQADSRWGDKLLIGGKSMSSAGCGPTSIAMALSQITGQMITPDTVATIGSEHLPGYSTFSLFPTVANKLGMNYEESTDTNKVSFIRNRLEKGLPVVLSGRSSDKNSPFTSEGHVVTATRIEGDKIFIQDPKGKELSKYYNIRDITPGLMKAMAYSPSSYTDYNRLPSSGKLNLETDIYKEYDKNPLGLYGDGPAGFSDEIAGSEGAEQVRIIDRVGSYMRAFLNNKNKFSYSQPLRDEINHNKSHADCSSFTGHVLTIAGDTPVSGTSQSIWDSVGTKVTKPQVGDIVCRQGHVGLYSGDGKFIHMTSSQSAGRTITETNVDTPYWGTFRGYKRVLKEPEKKVDPVIKNANSLLGTVTATASGTPVEGGSGLTDSTSTDTTTTTTQSETPELLGVFSKMNQLSQNFVGSMFNGKDVDLFTTTSSSSTDTSNGNLQAGVAGDYLGKYGCYGETSGQPNYVSNGSQWGDYDSFGIYQMASMGNTARDSTPAGFRDWTQENYPSLASYFKGTTVGNRDGGTFKTAWKKAATEKPNELIDAQVKFFTKPGLFYQDWVTKLKNKHNFNVESDRAYQEMIVGAAANGFYQAKYAKAFNKGLSGEALVKEFLKGRYSERSNKNYDKAFYNRFISENGDFKHLKEVIGKPAIAYGYSGASAGTGSDSYGYTDYFLDNADEIPEELMYGSESAGKESTTSSSDKYPATMNNYAYFSQVDPRWNKSGIGGTTVAKAGCGPTSHAMMLTTMFGKQINPYTMAKWGLSKGTWSSSGMGWNMPTAVAKNFGLSITKTWQGKSDSTLSSIKEQLKSGHPVVMSGRTSGSNRNYSTPFTPGGHIVLAVGVDGSGNIIINDPRAANRSKAYTDSGLREGIGLRGAWAFSKTGSSSIPSGFTVDGDYVPGASIAVDGTDTTTTTQAETPELLGVFSKMNQLMQNYVASIFNGKDVDLFATSNTSTTDTTTTNATGTGDFPKYNLNDNQIKGLAAIIQTEQPGYDGCQAEASLLANLTDISGDDKATTENIIAKATGGWFGKRAVKAFNSPGTAKQIAIDAVKNVIVNGRRTLPRYVNEHDCFSDIKSASNNGSAIKISDRSAYKQHVTKIKNVYGATGTFYGFPNSQADPFFYTSDKYRQKWGENCYEPLSAGSGDNLSKMSGSAGKGDGDGKVHLIAPATDNKAKPVTSEDVRKANKKGFIRIGLGDTVEKIKKLSTDLLNNENISSIKKYGNNVVNYSDNKNISICLDGISEMLDELKQINTNTANTAENISKIQIYSEFEPASNYTNQNSKVKKHNTTINNNSRAGSLTNSDDYKIARKLASFV